MRRVVAYYLLWGVWLVLSGIGAGGGTVDSELGCATEFVFVFWFSEGDEAG
jgi:hypothetical protein